MGRMTSTPGNFSPCRNSKLAPPPVEMWVNLSANPDAWAAAAESPPPTTLTAELSEIARATPKVPAANSGVSNTPIGPFQKIVLARWISFAYRATVLGPMSTPIQPSSIAAFSVTFKESTSLMSRVMR